MESETNIPTTNSTEQTPNASESPTQNDSPQNEVKGEPKLTLENMGEWDEALKAAKGKDPQLHEEEEETDRREPGEREPEGEPENKPEEGEEEDGAEQEEAADRPQKRDYSKFDPEDVPALKQMSNAAFKVVEKRFDEFKSALAEKDSALAEVKDGKTLPDEWYNDPAAGEASPEYKEVKVEFDKAQAETHRLGTLLDAYEDGQLKYDAATGRFVPNDDETPVSKAVSRQISDARAQLFEKQKELATKGNGLLQNFGKVYSTAKSEVDTVTEKMLPWSKDEKHAWHKAYKDLLAKVPKVFRNHPLARQNAALAAAAISYKILAEEKDKQLKAKVGVRNDQRLAGPVPRKGGKATNGELDKKMTLRDF